MRPVTRSRLRPWLLLTLLVLTAIYLFTGARSTQTSEFYTRTVAAMDARRKAVNEGLGAGSLSNDKAAIAQNAAEAKVRGSDGEIRLAAVPDHEGGKGEQVSHRASAGSSSGKQAPLAGEDEDEETLNPKGKSKSKGKTASKAADDEEESEAIHGPVDADDKSGRKKVKGKGDEDDGVAKVGNTGKQHESPGDSEVDTILDGILKKSPIIIFSKSYCPYSKKAKRILLEEYKIVPAPFVHEIDLMEEPKSSGSSAHEETIGSRLQSKLFEMTKRRTVPNVLVHGVSIGGGDDIESLHEKGLLADKIIEIGGKRIMEVKKLSAKDKSQVKFKA